MSSLTELEASFHAELASLKRDEAEKRYDAAALASLDAQGRTANQIFASLRANEHQSVWERGLDVYPGMDFHGARDAGLHLHHNDTAIDEHQHQQHPLPAWQILRRMPKGALLHAHFDGTVDIRFLLAHALQTPNMCIKATQALDSIQALHSAEVRFMVLPQRPSVPQPSSIWTPNYIPDTWVPYAEARSAFPHPHPYLSSSSSSSATTADTPDRLPPYLFPSADPGSCFDAYVHSLTTLTPHNAAPPIANSKQAWAKFISTFAVIGGLLGYEPIFRAYVKEMLRSHLVDGIGYTEVRLNFFDPFMVRADGTPDLSHREWVRIYGEVIEEFRADPANTGFYGSRIIYSTVRIISPEKLREYCQDCLELKLEFPHLIAGFDLVGHEDVGTPLRTYASELIRFRHNAAAAGVEIPFVFHAGETLVDGEGADENLYDAIALGTRRIGHGLSLARHGHLADLARERNICIEVCPISNQLLGYASSVASHPSLLPLLHRGVPIALSSDDPAIFENHGLSYDFYQLAMASASTTLASLGVLARNSISHTLAQEHEKAAWTAQFDVQWQQFLKWVVTEYDQSRA